LLQLLCIANQGLIKANGKFLETVTEVLGSRKEFHNKAKRIKKRVRDVFPTRF